MAALTATAAFAALVAGCLAVPPASEAGSGGTPSPIVPGFAQDHDHLDPALHAFSSGIEALAYHNLVPDSDGRDATERGDWLNSEIIVRGDYAYVGYLGGPWRVAIVNVSDPAAPRLEGVFATSNAWTMDIAVSEDGDWVFASFYPGATGALFSQDYLASGTSAPDGAAAPGLALLDARDRASPKLAAFLPVHGLGPHTAVYHKYPDGREVVFANRADVGVGQAVVIADVVATPDGGRAFAPVGAYSYDLLKSGEFPHDVDVAEHPITGATLMYAAYWRAGLVIVDVTDPAKPVLVGQFTDYPEGEESNVHDAHPFPRLVDGKHYTFTGPEMPVGDTSGHLRVYDTTDPSKPSLVGSWVMPGDFVVDQPFSFSVHNFAFLPDGRVALAHGHAGVWIIDWLGPGGEAAPDPQFMAAPRAVAYMVPSAPGAAPPAWSPVHGAPWVWGTAIDARGNVWAADVASGLWGLRVTG